MPAPLAVDKEAVRAHAITFGVREAARAFGLAEDTVKQWSCRGKWLSPPVSPVHQLPVTMRPQPVPAVTASQAALSTLSRIGGKTRLKLAKATLHGSRALAAMTGEQVVERAAQLKAVVDAGDKLHGWSDARQAETKHSFTVDVRLGALGQMEPEPIDDAITVEHGSIDDDPPTV